MKKVIWIIAFLFSLFAGSFVSAQKPFTPRDTTITGPQTFAMILGISNYRFIKSLQYADKDAELFKDYLKSPGGGSVKEDNFYCLLNNQVTSTNFFVKGNDWLEAKQLQKGDKLFIYLAGHGDAIDEELSFFLGYDCNPRGDKNTYMSAGETIQLYSLKKSIIKQETKKGVEVFFIMDACRSGELPGGIAGQNFINKAISEKPEGEVIMLAASAGQLSWEDVSIGNGHGLFTYYLVDGLNGSADTIDGSDNKVTLREIQAYVNKNVPFVAEQRFKRKQDPYFCCTENSEKVISIVDTTYLQKWLETKKQENKGAGNSYNGFLKEFVQLPAADTGLLEIYNRFYAAVNENKLTGESSAENYFELLNKKYPGNPYTLDAKSTLAVEFINLAQAKVERYLGCGDDGSTKEKQANYTAAIDLEKAINLIREKNEYYANSLYNRMYFLKACGDFGKDGKNGDSSVAFQNAYAALSINPNGAYVQNKLALLHLANNQNDSAFIYAEKATKTAPGWVCAFTTLALVQKALSKNQNRSVEASLAIEKKVITTIEQMVVTYLQPQFNISSNVPLSDYTWHIRSGNESTAMVPLTNTSGRIVFKIPKNLTGRFSVSARNDEGKEVFSDDINVLSVNGTLGSSTLAKGQRTKYTVKVDGLKDCPYPFSLVIINKSISGIIFDKGNHQTYRYDPENRKNDTSSLIVKVGVTGNIPGKYFISVNLILPASAFGDIFHYQKSALNTPEDYNAWVAVLKKDLKAYADKQGNDNAGNTVKANAQRAIDNIPDCDDINKLDKYKAIADSYLRQVNIPKDIASMWACRFEAYKAAVKAINSAISGSPELINWEVIKDGIEFIGQRGEQLKNEKLQKGATAAKNMVETIQEKGESKKNLKELKDKLDELNSGLTGK
jgi:hypothetical protein